MSAGNGMRLRPLTNDFSKCMLPVGGKPMLEWWLDAAFQSECFDKIYVNIHHLADQVREWIQKYATERRRKNIFIIDEPQLLGTAKTLYNHAVPGEDFMVAYTDTYSASVFAGLPRLVDDFQRMPNSFMAGLITFDAPEDKSTGNIDADALGVVRSFKEKSESGKIAWAGIIFARAHFLHEITEQDKDLAHDVLPRCAWSIKVLRHVDAYDIGRGVEHYERVRGGFKK